MGRPLFWLLFVGIITAFPVIRALRVTLPPRLPVLGELAPFSLEDQQGHRWGSTQLAGRAWVADFVYTGCAKSAITAERMRSIQHRARNLGDGLHLVSFTIASASDNQAVRLEWARAHAANPRVWAFVGGEGGPVDAAVRGLGGPPPGSCAVSELVLLDGRSRIRGRYPPDDPGALDRLLRDAGLLINRGD